MFDSLNNLKDSLNFLTGNSPEELELMLKQINLPVQIISIYSSGSKHYAWFITTAKIKKVKEKSNG